MLCFALVIGVSSAYVLKILHENWKNQCLKHFTSSLENPRAQLKLKFFLKCKNDSFSKLYTTKMRTKSITLNHTFYKRSNTTNMRLENYYQLYEISFFLHEILFAIFPLRLKDFSCYLSYFIILKKLTFESGIDL